MDKKTYSWNGKVIDERTYNMLAGIENPMRPEDEKRLLSLDDEWIKKAKANAKKDN